jgi:hypothetical protein
VSTRRIYDLPSRSFNFKPSYSWSALSVGGYLSEVSPADY